MACLEVQRCLGVGWRQENPWTIMGQLVCRHTEVLGWWESLPQTKSGGHLRNNTQACPLTPPHAHIPHTYMNTHIPKKQSKFHMLHIWSRAFCMWSSGVFVNHRLKTHGECVLILNIGTSFSSLVHQRCRTTTTCIDSTNRALGTVRDPEVI